MNGTHNSIASAAAIYVQFCTYGSSGQKLSEQHLQPSIVFTIH